MKIRKKGWYLIVSLIMLMEYEKILKIFDWNFIIKVFFDRKLGLDMIWWLFSVR